MVFVNNVFTDIGYMFAADKDAGTLPSTNAVRHPGRPRERSRRSDPVAFPAAFLL